MNSKARGASSSSSRGESFSSSSAKTRISDLSSNPNPTPELWAEKTRSLGASAQDELQVTSRLQEQKRVCAHPVTMHMPARAHGAIDPSRQGLGDGDITSPGPNSKHLIIHWCTEEQLFTERLIPPFSVTLRNAQEQVIVNHPPVQVLMSLHLLCGALASDALATSKKRRRASLRKRFATDEQGLFLFNLVRGHTTINNLKITKVSSKFKGKHFVMRATCADVNGTAIFAESPAFTVLSYRVKVRQVPRHITLTTRVENLPTVGDIISRRLHGLGLHTAGDLVRHHGDREWMAGIINQIREDRSPFTIDSLHSLITYLHELGLTDNNNDDDGMETSASEAESELENNPIAMTMLVSPSDCESTSLSPRCHTDLSRDHLGHCDDRDDDDDDVVKEFVVTVMDSPTKEVHKLSSRCESCDDVAMSPPESGPDVGWFASDSESLSVSHERDMDLLNLLRVQSPLRSTDTLAFPQTVPHLCLRGSDSESCQHDTDADSDLDLDLDLDLDYDVDLHDL